MEQTLDSYKEFIEKTILIPIAVKEFYIYSWETQHSDRLDFYDVGINSIRDALWEAFKSGRSYQFELNKK